MKYEWKGLNSHNDQYCRDHDALHPTAQDGVGYDGERLVDDHVCKEKGNKKKVTILANGLDPVCIEALCA